KGWKRLNGKDLKIDSKYNTYKYFGLPPGPINNPGKDALLAALYPENHKFLFFVADTKGGHLFSQNFSGHKKLAQEYYKWLNQQSKN
ncbi:MAG: endolytic transglycosylase MltG, partial [Ignavibacteriaceae bacterium]|nr:endolytic transglycosylase MltG [Ignavibacteriaceae bacterium]